MKVSLITFSRDGEKHKALAVNFNPATTEYDALICDKPHCFDDNINAGDAWYSDNLDNHDCLNVAVYGSIDIDELQQRKETELDLQPSPLAPKYVKFRNYLNDVVAHYNQHGTLNGFSIHALRHKCVNISKEQFFMFNLHNPATVLTDELIISIRDQIAETQKNRKNK